MTPADEAPLDETPPDGAPPERPEPPAIPPPTNPFELYRRNRARVDILVIGAIAVGGIVCMAIATALVVWQLSRQ